MKKNKNGLNTELLENGMTLQTNYDNGLKNGIEIYVLLGTVIESAFVYLNANSMPCVQLSTAIAYGAPKNSAIFFSNSVTNSKFISVKLFT